jgi:hypothetical protein
LVAGLGSFSWYDRDNRPHRLPIDQPQSVARPDKVGQVLRRAWNTEVFRIFRASLLTSGFVALLSRAGQ